MARRIAAIAFIFVCTTIAWVILGSTLFMRTYQSESALRGRVQSTWGAPHEQSPPTATWEEVRTQSETVSENGRLVPRTWNRTQTVPLPLEQSRVRVDLALHHRQKGLRWFSTYGVDFAGRYVFRNPSSEPRTVSFALRFPTSQALYDNLTFTVDGVAVPRVNTRDTTRGSAVVPAGGAAVLQVGYRSQGLDSWTYALGSDVAEARDFELRMHTNFAAVDFPDNSLSPTIKARRGDGWDLAWSYRSLLSGFRIAMIMPEHLQPGPLAGRISYFAPVSLFFFFFLMWILTTLRGLELHPMNYFFLAAAFFAFHLLLAYLVDHVSIHVAFAIASVVSIALVVSYLRIVLGARFAIVEAGVAQLLYLVLFSYAFFFEGWTGLTVTVGAILTLFVVMQMTARIRWADAFAGGSPARGAVR
jgi:hypothetical protein